MLLYLYRGIFRNLTQSTQFIQAFSGITRTVSDIQPCLSILGDITAY